MKQKTLLNENDNTEKLPCAWCNAEQGKSQGEGSHGICEQHSIMIYSQLAERKLAKTERIR